MRNDPHSFSSRKAALLVMSSLLGLAGCSEGSQFLSADKSFLTPLRLETFMPSAPLLTASTAKAPHAYVPLRPRIEPAADIRSDNDLLSPESNLWCRHFYENADASAIILRSPTLAGSSTEKGRVTLNLSLSASDFVKADIVQKQARANCRKFLAEASLQTIVFVSPQNLTAAGFKARADAISSQRKDVAKLRGQIERAMRKGSIDREKAGAISILIDRLLAEGSNAQSQADRRIDEHPRITKSVETLKRELLAAESDIDDLTNRTRTADNMDVSLHAGYSNSDLFNDEGQSHDDFNGKVSFSLKLGAIDPRRFEHERISKELKQQALQSGEQGILWQVEALRHSHENAIAGLVESEKKISSAMKEARQLLIVLDSVPQPDFEGARLNTRFEIMKLKADRAGVTGSIAEIRSNLKRLQNG
jgi:hypothetical protein